MSITNKIREAMREYFGSAAKADLLKDLRNAGVLVIDLETTKPSKFDLETFDILEVHLGIIQRIKKDQ